MLANDAVNLSVRQGSVHAIVGENGTGKTTLMRIAHGELLPDQGEVWVQGRRLPPGDTRAAIDSGLGMVHQHFMLIPTLTVAQNVVLGNEPHGRLWMDHAEARRLVLQTSQKFGLEVDPDARVETLSVGVQQRVEIIKVLQRGARVLVLDEPTAVLTPNEVHDFFTILRQLVEQGHSIVLISHRLKEVLSVADEITVMRRGRVVAHVDAAAARESELAQLIVGRELRSVSRSRSSGRAGKVVLSCLDVSLQGVREELRQVSFDVHAGEILGVAGVEGNGQQSLAEILLGLRKPTEGSVQLCGQELQNAGPSLRRSLGMAYVPADRLREGVIGPMRVDENMLLGRQTKAFWQRGPFLRWNRIQERCGQLLREYDVRPADVTLPVESLSGGNQQRLLLARELDRDPTFLLLAQPTRGIDVGGIAFIHQRILDSRDAGKAILIISADLKEIFTLADRIVVLFKGRILGPIHTDEATTAGIGKWMTGTGNSP